MRSLLVLLMACVVPAAAGAQEKPLQAGVALTPPFVEQDKTGHLAGFTVDLFRAIAARMKRDIVFVQAAPSALMPGLANGRFDLLPGPVTATPERASEMLFVEGYMWSEYQFGARRAAPVSRMEDLRGRRLAVEQATPYDEWAERNAGRYGFTRQTYATPAETIAAVLHDQADASLAGSTFQREAAAHNSAYGAGLSLPETRAQETAAFQKADIELRDEAEDAMGCLKQDGTLDRLSRAWFGTEPGQEDLENLVVPGYGIPGLAGYDPKSRKFHC